MRRSRPCPSVRRPMNAPAPTDPASPARTVPGWRRALPIAVSLAIFIAPHIVFFGPTWLFHQLVGSLALVAFTLIRRNLVATMLLHLLVNAPILIPTVLAKL